MELKDEGGEVVGGADRQVERSSFNFFKPTTKIEEIILKSESVLS